MPKRHSEPKDGLVACRSALGAEWWSGSSELVRGVVPAVA